MSAVCSLLPAAERTPGKTTATAPKEVWGKRPNDGDDLKVNFVSCPSRCENYYLFL